MSSMSNAGQGTRGMSGSDWTRMKKLNRSKTYGSPPAKVTVESTVNASGQGVSVTKPSNNNVLAYVGGKSVDVVSITNNAITFNNSGAAVAANTPIKFTTSFCGITAGTPYALTSALTGNTTTSSTIYLNSDSVAKTAITLSNSSGTATCGGISLTITYAGTDNFFHYTSDYTLAGDMPIVVLGTPGGVTSGNTYYIATVDSNKFFLYSGGKQSGSGTKVEVGNKGFTDTSVAATVYGVTVSVTGSNSDGTLTLQNAAAITPGQIISFNTAFSGLSSDTNYIVKTYSGTSLTLYNSDGNARPTITTGIGNGILASPAGNTPSIYPLTDTTYSTADTLPLTGQAIKIAGLGLDFTAIYYTTSTATSFSLKNNSGADVIPQVSTGASVNAAKILVTSSSDVSGNSATVTTSAISLTITNTYNGTATYPNTLACTMPTQTLVNGQAVRPSSGFGGLDASTTYYIANLKTDNDNSITYFQVSNVPYTAIPNPTNIVSITGGVTGTLTFWNSVYFHNIAGTYLPAVGQLVQVTSASLAAANGMFTVLARDTTTITVASITQTTAGTTNTLGATIRYHTIQSTTRQLTPVTVGQSVMFTSASGSLATNKQYVIVSINTAGHSFQISDGLALTTLSSSSTGTGYVLTTTPNKVISTTATSITSVSFGSGTFTYTSSNKVLTQNQIVTFTGTGLSGITAGVPYYIINPSYATTGTFQVATRPGGTSISSISGSSINATFAGYATLTSAPTLSQPVIFDNTLGDIIGGTTYYVCSVFGTNVCLSTSLNFSVPLSITTSSTGFGGYFAGCTGFYYSASTLAGALTMPASNAAALQSGQAALMWAAPSGLVAGTPYFLGQLASTGATLYSAPNLVTTLSSIGITSGSYYGITVATTTLTKIVAQATTIYIVPNPQQGYTLMLNSPVNGTTTTLAVGTPYYIGGEVTTNLVTSKNLYDADTITSRSFWTPAITTLPTFTTQFTVTKVSSTGNLTVTASAQVPLAGQPYTFDSPFCGITAGTTYYIASYNATTGVVTLITPPTPLYNSPEGNNINCTTPANSITITAVPNSSTLTVSSPHNIIATGQAITVSTNMCGWTNQTYYAANTYAADATSIALWTTASGTTSPTLYTSGGSATSASQTLTITSVDSSGVITIATPSNVIVNGLTFLPASPSFCTLALATYTIRNLSGNTFTLNNSPSITASTGTGVASSIIDSGTFSSPLVFMNSNTNTVLNLSGTLNSLGSGVGFSVGVDKYLVFGVKSNVNQISFYVDLTTPNSGKIFVNTGTVSSGVLVSTGFTANRYDTLSFTVIGGFATFYNNGILIYVSSVATDGYSFFSKLTDGTLVSDQTLTVSYSQTISTSDLLTNQDIAPQMSAQFPYNQSLLVKPVVGTSKTRRTASNWTDFIASQHADFITTSQNTGTNGTGQPGIIQTLTKICDGSNPTPGKNTLPWSNQFNHLKILS